MVVVVLAPAVDAHRLQHCTGVSLPKRDAGDIDSRRQSGVLRCGLIRTCVVAESERLVPVVPPTLDRACIGDGAVMVRPG